MKKLFFILISIILAITLSSFASSDQTEKKVKTTNGDTVLVKTSVNISVPKYQKADDILIERATGALDQLIELQRDRNLLVEGALLTDKTKLDQICESINWTPDKLFKKARADTIIRFCTSVIIIILVVLGLYSVVKTSQKLSVTWQSSVVIAILLVIVAVLIHQHLYYILSYLFNSDYLKIKEIITLIK